MSDWEKFKLTLQPAEQQALEMAERVKNIYSEKAKKEQIEEQTARAKMLVGTYWLDSQNRDGTWVKYLKVLSSVGMSIKYLEVTFDLQHVNDRTAGLDVNLREADNPWIGGPYNQSCKRLDKKEFEAAVNSALSEFIGSIGP